MRAWVILLIGWGLFTCPSAAAAGQPQFGEEILVATGAQLPSVAMGVGGEFVVLWEDKTGAGQGFFGQIFDRRGRRRGRQFEVSGPGTYSATASASTDGQGQFVVAWQFSVFSEETGWYGYRLGRHHLYARRFDSTGTASSAQFELASNDGYGSTALDPEVAMSPGGAFVVVWYATDSGQGIDVRAQRFDRSGQSVGEPLDANDTRFHHFWQPDVAMADDASFVVMWDYPTSPTLSPELGVSGARFSAGGARIGEELEIVAPDRGRAGPAAVASAADGSFVVVWWDNELGILGRRYDAGGVALGVTFVVNDRVRHASHSPTIAMSPDGAFFVAWTVAGEHGGGVFGQHLDADGRRLGDEVPIARSAPGHFHFEPSVAVAANGSVVVAWESGGQRSSVLARVAAGDPGGGGGGGDPGGDGDHDGDGVIDGLDNCPTVPNPDQLDAAADGYGDDCVSPDVVLPPDLRLGANPIIGMGTRIGIRVSIGNDVRIGEDVDIRRNVSIDDRALIGPLVTLFAGAHIGADARVETGAIVGRRAIVLPGALVPAGTSVPPGATVE